MTTDGQSLLHPKVELAAGTALIGILMAALLLTGVGAQSYRNMLFVAAAVGGVVVGGAIFLRPELGAYLLIFTIVTNLSNMLEVNGFPGINKPLVGLVAVSLLANSIRRQSPVLRLKAPELLLFAFGLTTALTFLVASDRTEVLSWTVDFAKDAIILTCIAYAVQAPQQLRRAGWMVVLSASLLAAMGAYQVLSGNYAQDFAGLATVHVDPSIAGEVSAVRLQGPLDDPNFYGMIMASVLPLAVYRVLAETDRRLRLAGLGASLLIGFAVVYSYSRGAFLAMVMAMAMIVLDRRISVRVQMALVGMALLLALVLPESYRARLGTLTFLRQPDPTSLYRDNSLRGRSSEMQAGLLMWQDHPVLGVGIENYPANYQQYAQEIGLEYRSEDRQAHSLYIQFLAETGTVGTGVFFAFLIAVFAGFVRARSVLRSMTHSASWGSWVPALRAGLVAYLVSSIFLHADYFRYFILLTALAVAAMHVVDAESQRQQELGNLQAAHP
jgi:O-antigen ligase